MAHQSEAQVKTWACNWYQLASEGEAEGSLVGLNP